MVKDIHSFLQIDHAPSIYLKVVVVCVHLQTEIFGQNSLHCML